MKYVQYTTTANPEEVQVGYLDGASVVEICCKDCSMPRSMLDLIKLGALDKFKPQQTAPSKTVPLSSVKLAAPIHGMDKVLGIEVNYTDYCSELNIEPPTTPVIFNKFASTIIGTNERLTIRTEFSKKVDWAVELAVIIGKPATYIKAEYAYRYIFGYTIAQDITDREWQNEKNGTQFLLGKSLDTFCPLGPYIVTRDEINDANNLDIVCKVNGRVTQKSNTSNMIHKIPDIIERLTEIMTLLPGDLILTGTPAGTGSARDPPQFLKPGDVVRSEIQNIGAFDIFVGAF